MLERLSAACADGHDDFLGLRFGHQSADGIHIHVLGIAGDIRLVIHKGQLCFHYGLCGRLRRLFRRDFHRCRVRYGFFCMVNHFLFRLLYDHRLNVGPYRSRFRSDLFRCRLRCRGRLAPHNRRDRLYVRRIRLGHRCELDAETGVGQCHVQSIMLRSLNIQTGRRVFLCHGGNVAAGGVGIIFVKEYLCLNDRQLIRDAQRRQPRASGRIFQPEPELFISQLQLVSVGSLFQESQRIEACDTVQLRHDGDSIEQSGFGCIHFKSSFLNKNMRQGVDLTRLPHFYKIFTVILKHCAAAL